MTRQNGPPGDTSRDVCVFAVHVELRIALAVEYHKGLSGQYLKRGTRVGVIDGVFSHGILELDSGEKPLEVSLKFNHLVVGSKRITLFAHNLAFYFVLRRAFIQLSLCGQSLLQVFTLCRKCGTVSLLALRYRFTWVTLYPRLVSITADSLASLRQSLTLGVTQ